MVTLPIVHKGQDKYCSILIPSQSNCKTPNDYIYKCYHIIYVTIFKIVT